MKKLFILMILIIWVNNVSLKSQQIGEGYAPQISNLNLPLLSGNYTAHAPTGSIPIGSWQHIFVIRHGNSTNNYQLQIGSSIWQDERLFFRKISVGSLDAGNTSWIELATRNSNTFNGNQQISGGNLTLSGYFGNSNAPLKLNVNHIGSYYYGSNMTEIHMGEGDGSNLDGKISFFYNSVSRIDIAHNSTIVASFLADGKVGIGTTQPNAALSIFSDENWSGGWRNNLTLVSNDYPCIKLNSTGSNKISMIGNNNDGGLYFGVNCTSTSFGSYAMVILPNGNIGVGTLDPKGYKLAVAGRMIAEEVVIKTQATWPDFVFSPTYKLPTLSEVEQFVKTNQHLPEIPSATEMQQQGVSVSEMQVKLLQKVEELTLYMIELKKENESLKSEIEKIKNK